MRHGRSLFGADCGLTLFIVDLYGQHTRCCFDGPLGLWASRVSGHTLDLNHGARHVGRESIIRGKQFRQLRKTQEADRDNGHAPKHNLVEYHNPRCGRISCCAAWLIGQVECGSQERKRNRHEDRPIFRHEGHHPRTGDSAHNQQGRQPAS